MAKVVDITEKLNFEEKPVIKVKGETLTVNNEAVALIEIMPLLDGVVTPTSIHKICGTIFSKEDYKKIEKMQLDIKDFSTLVLEAINLVTGETQPGEAQTPATT